MNYNNDDVDNLSGISDDNYADKYSNDKYIKVKLDDNSEEHSIYARDVDINHISNNYNGNNVVTPKRNLMTLVFGSLMSVALLCTAVFLGVMALNQEKPIASQSIAGISFEAGRGTEMLYSNFIVDDYEEYLTVPNTLQYLVQLDTIFGYQPTKFDILNDLKHHKFDISYYEIDANGNYSDSIKYANAAGLNLMIYYAYQNVNSSMPIYDVKVVKMTKITKDILTIKQRNQFVDVKGKNLLVSIPVNKVNTISYFI